MKKRYSLGHTLSRLYGGQTIARVLMNRALAEEKISGLTVDVGGGRHPDYFSYLQVAPDTRIEPLDLSLNDIDLEKDALPYASASVDTVLMCNILEHIYHHQHLLTEAWRVLRPEGSLIGFVPFWVGYHPDPHDYFRYTDEALHKLLDEAGFVGIEVKRVGRGPFIANFNTIMLSFPRVVRPFLYLWYAGLDCLFMWLRPNSVKRFPLGYVFMATLP